VFKVSDNIFRWYCCAGGAVVSALYCHVEFNQARTKFARDIPLQRRTQTIQLWWIDWVFTWSKVRQRGS